MPLGQRKIPVLRPRGEQARRRKQDSIERGFYTHVRSVSLVSIHLMEDGEEDIQVKMPGEEKRKEASRGRRGGARKRRPVYGWTHKRPSILRPRRELDPTGTSPLFAKLTVCDVVVL